MVSARRWSFPTGRNPADSSPWRKGALLAFPIVVSIVLITWGIGFSGTVHVATRMLLSVVYLLAWDGDRIREASSRVLGARRGPPLLAGATGLEKAGWVLGAAVGRALVVPVSRAVPLPSVVALAVLLLASPVAA